MYTYRRELSAGYLVLRPNLEKLFNALAGWETHYGPCTVVPGRRMGKCFARLAQIDIQAILAGAPPDQPLYLIGNRDSVIYLCVIKLTAEDYVVVDTFPDLIEFEYDKNHQTGDKRLTEGIVLSGIQVIVPFVLLSAKQRSLIFLSIKRSIPELERVPHQNAYVAEGIHIQVTLQDDLVPPRTVLTISSNRNRLIWNLHEKLILYGISKHCEIAVEILDGDNS